MSRRPPAPPRDPDAALCETFRLWRLECEKEGDDESPTEERRLADIVAAASAATPTGLLIKLAHLIYLGYDSYGINDPEHPIPKSLASLEASAIKLPQDLADVVRFAAKNIRILICDLKEAHHRAYVTGEVAVRLGVNRDALMMAVRIAMDQRTPPAHA